MKERKQRVMEKHDLTMSRFMRNSQNINDSSFIGELADSKITIKESVLIDDKNTFTHNLYQGK